jgi:hypothetical protein
MIGKRARPPKKTNVLFLLGLMYYLKSIPLWSLPYQFTCNLQCDCLIIVFHHQYKHQQGTIHCLSPGRTPYFVPKSKMIFLC